MWLSENGLARSQPSGKSLDFDGAPIRTRNLHLSYEYVKTRGTGCCRRIKGDNQLCFLFLSKAKTKVENLLWETYLFPYRNSRSLLFSVQMAQERALCSTFLQGEKERKTLTCFHIGFDRDIRPDSGHAYIFGLDCFEDKQKIREFVSFMEQEDVLLELLTVDQFLKVICDVRCVDYSVLPEFLRVMDLLGFENALLNTLSGGQRRKVLCKWFVCLECIKFCCVVFRFL